MKIRQIYTDYIYQIAIYDVLLSNLGYIHINTGRLKCIFKYAKLGDRKTLGD